MFMGEKMKKDGRSGLSTIISYLLLCQLEQIGHPDQMPQYLKRCEPDPVLLSLPLVQALFLLPFDFFDRVRALVE